jgi:phage baseplate assembly protein W
MSATPLDRGRAYLGEGLAFPLRVTPHGRLATARAEAKIEAAIWLVLATAIGERVMRPYGCGIHDMVFEPANTSALAQLGDLARHALSEQEPRIAVLDVDVETSVSDPSAVIIRVAYRIHENNSIASLVYPYFIREGV